MNQTQKLEEYKLFVEDTARFSDRRQTASNIYVAVNAALVAGIGLLIAEVTKGAPWLILIALVLLGAGILVCKIWRLLIIKYDHMIEFRCRQLEKMESDIEGSHCMIKKVGHEIERIGSFSSLEAKLPRVFIGVYGVLIALILIGLCLWLWHDALIQALCSLCPQPQ